MKRLIVAASALILIAGFLLGAWWYRKDRAQTLGSLARSDSSIFVREHSPTYGAPDAKVHLVKFTDPACETCAQFSGFVKEVMEANPGKIKLIVRYAPFHEGAIDFARILEAAKRQGRFWETLDVLYASQPEWAIHHVAVLDKVWPFLPEAGVDVERIRRDMQDPEITRVIEQDLKDAETLGVRKTPGFFVNGRPLEPFGARPLLDLIFSEIAANYEN